MSSKTPKEKLGNPEKLNKKKKFSRNFYNFPEIGERESVWALSLSEALNIRHIDIYQKCFDGYENALNLPPEQIRSIGLIKPRKTYEGREALLKKLYKVKKQCQEHNLKTITIVDQEYPLGLKEIYHPPLVLYYRGTLQKYYPNKKGCYLAIVGTRRSDSLAEYITRKIAKDFSTLGGHIISGLAIGIDTQAHLGACEAGTTTTAVLGCGVDIHYPWGNRKLYSRIIDSGGAIISEYQPGTPPLSFNFPYRNRIISGLSEGVLMTQAPIKSGALITIDFALDQGRTVYVYDFKEDVMYGSDSVPERNSGNYKLIQEGAVAITSLVDLFDHQFSFLKKKFDKQNLELSTLQKPVSPSHMSNHSPNFLDRICIELQAGPKTLTQLSHILQMNAGEISPLLLEGVISNRIKELPGKKYFLT